MKIIGTGLACLDIIEKKNERIIMNGGTCANVLTVLAQLGVKSGILIPDYKTDLWRDIFYQTFEALHVSVLKYCAASWNIPRIIESFDRDNQHIFYTKCPGCRRNLIRSKWITEKEAESVMNEILEYEIFFTDRVSDGIKNFAVNFLKLGKKVFYEPNSGRNLKTVIAMSKISDVVKFSTDKISIGMANKILEQCSGSSLKLLIATQGENGLLFSYKTDTGIFSDWINGPCVVFETAKDTSGAGDWLTAGFLFYWEKVHFEMREEVIYKALEKGLLLSNLASSVEGAQGAFYDRDMFEKLRQEYSIRMEDKLSAPDYSAFFKNNEICGTCLLEKDFV